MSELEEQPKQDQYPTDVRAEIGALMEALREAKAISS